MAKIEHFEDLKCWQESRKLVKLTYSIVNDNSELKKGFDTASQIRRAAVSIMNNISEGFGRYNKKDMIRFLDYAQSSALEVKSMTYLLEDNFHTIDKSEILRLRDRSDRTKSIILGFIKYLRKGLNSESNIVQEPDSAYDNANNENINTSTH